MALSATIFKVNLSIADMDRHYYGEHQLTIARHPSESDKRMMLRIVAFIMHANENLAFTKGLSDVELPDIWLKNLHDGIELWIELGQPSEQRIKKGCNQSKQMSIFSYQNNAFEQWWLKEEKVLTLRKNLTIHTLPEALGEQLANQVSRQMAIQCSIQDGQAWFTFDNESFECTPTKILPVN